VSPATGEGGDTSKLAVGKPKGTGVWVGRGVAVAGWAVGVGVAVETPVAADVGVAVGGAVGLPGIAVAENVGVGVWAEVGVAVGGGGGAPGSVKTVPKLDGPPASVVP